MINNLASEIHKNAKNKGFYDEKKNTGEMLMLIVTEVAEACEADRKDKFTDLYTFNKYDESEFLKDDIVGDELSFKSNFEDNIKDTFEDELADIMIRVMDLASYKGVNLEWHIKNKMRYNSMREHKHGKKY